MEHRIDKINRKQLAGRHMRMSLSKNRTAELWQGFMKVRNEIKGAIGSELYSMQVYDPSYFRPFDSHKEFEKWAAVEVGEAYNIPDDMETIILPEGLYAVFIHKGAADTAPESFGYIFGTWLPQSGYILDDRPHFEILGEKYKNDQPDSEEEIWIPIKPQ